MSKRNFILLIIILGISAIAVFGFLYFRQDVTDKTGEDSGGTNFISQFNPFAKSKPPTPAVTPPNNDSVENQPPTVETSKMKFAKVSSMPIAGFTIYAKERFKEYPVVTPTPTPEGIGVPTSSTTPSKSVGTEFAPALRYVDRATGNIYQTFADNLEEQKFSITIVPKVHEAHFGPRGETVIMRYLKEDDRTIETFVGALPKEILGGDTIENNEIKGTFLPNNVQDLSLSPDASKAFYLFNSSDRLAGATLNFSNNKKIQVFDSPFTEWLSSWPTTNTITLTTKPSAGVPGHIYSIDSAGKNLTRILGDVNGLTTLPSPNPKLILLGDNNLSLDIYHTDTRGRDQLGIRTLPEKCIWNKAGSSIYCAAPKFIAPGKYPDAWYQGEVSWNDQIWKIDVKTGNATLILDPITVPGGAEIDGIKLALDAEENYLFLINKKDSFLWKLDLK